MRLLCVYKHRAQLYDHDLQERNNLIILVLLYISIIYHVIQTIVLNLLYCPFSLL